MKKKIAFLLSLAMTLSMAGTTVHAKDDNKGYLYDLIYEKNMGFVNEKTDSPKVSWDKLSKTPRFILGKLSKTKVNNEDEAKKYLEDNMDAFKLTHGNFELISKTEDSLGYSHYKFKYVVDGLEVFASQVMIHTTNKGMVYSVNGQFQSTIPKKQYSKEVKLDLNSAINEVEKNVDKKFEKNESSLYLYNKDNKWIPVYKLELWNDDDVETWMAIVDAISGNVIKATKEGENVADTATGTGIRGDIKNLEVDKRNNTYYLENLSNKGKLSTYDAQNQQVIPGTLVSSKTNTFNEPVQAAAVDIHHYADKVYKYYKNVHGRESYDDNGAGMQLIVHYGQNYLNAYYNRRSALVFGDGDNKYAKDFAKALDIIAHEFTHAVTDKTAKLEYENQSGALNESFSDVFGILIENRDWTIGEDIVLPNAPIKLMRSMENPTLYNQPAHMKDYKNLPNTQQGDWGGVHTNSGIPNKAFYNVAKAIGKEKSGKIYYRALTSHLHAYSNFQDARDALETSAKELYGDAEKLEVAKAFYAVGIGEAPSETTISLKAANVTVDNATNDGNYTLTIALDGQNSAKTVKVLENGTNEVLNQNVNVETEGKTLTKVFTNKPEGTYNYTVEVSDGNQVLTSEVKVTVTNAPTLSLKAAKVTVDKATNDGNYTLTIALDGKNSAKTVRVLENGTTEVLNQNVNVEMNGKTITKAFSNKAAGTYNYVVEVSDGNDVVTSEVNVKVEKTTPTAKPWKAYTRYSVGDVVDYNGTTFKCVRSHYSIPGDNPNTLTRYWQKVL